MVVGTATVTRMTAVAIVVCFVIDMLLVLSA